MLVGSVLSFPFSSSLFPFSIFILFSFIFNFVHRHQYRALLGAVLMSVDNSNTIVRAVRAARHSYIIEVLPPTMTTSRREEIRTTSLY